MSAPSREQYKLITRLYPHLLDDIEITGTLLPDREPVVVKDADGNDVELQPIKGEDIAWALEFAEVMFFFAGNEDYWRSKDPIYDYISDYLSNRTDRFWRLDEWMMMLLTYWNIVESTVGGPSYGGKVYYSNQLFIDISEKRPYLYMCLLKKPFVDGINLPMLLSSSSDLNDQSYVSMWNEYFAKPSDIDLEKVIPQEASNGSYPIALEPINKIISIYKNIGDRASWVVESCENGKIINSSIGSRQDVVYYRYIYRYGSPDDFNSENIQGTTSDKANLSEISFDNHSFNFGSYSEHNSYKLYIGEMTSVKIVADCHYDCEQRKSIDYENEFEPVDIETESNKTDRVVVDIDSQYIFTDDYGIKYVDIPVADLCGIIKDRILEMRNYTPKSPDAVFLQHIDFIDKVLITMRQMYIVGRMPENLPPRAH